MTLDEIKLEWEKDCEVDDIELDKSSLEVPKLHAKYSDLLTSKILLLKNFVEVLRLEKAYMIQIITTVNNLEIFIIRLMIHLGTKLILLSRQMHTMLF